MQISQTEESIRKQEEDNRESQRSIADLLQKKASMSLQEVFGVKYIT